MKKLLVFLIFTTALLFSMPFAAIAEETKTAEVLITGQTEAKVGETIRFTAVTLKQGSTYEDSWSGAEKVETTLNEDGYYVSSGEFTAPAVGTYTVTYEILMIAGKSGVNVVGTGEATVTVSDDTVLTGVEVRNITAAPRVNQLGEITGYAAVGDVYLLWSDNTATLYGRIFFNLSADQITRNLCVNVIVDGVQYQYDVNVSRPVT